MVHQAAKQPEQDLLIEFGRREKLQGEQGLEQGTAGRCPPDQGLAADMAHHRQAQTAGRRQTCTQ